MRRKIIGCSIACVLVVVAFILVRVATRNKVEHLAELPGVGGFLTTGRGPFAHDDRLLYFSGAKLHLVDQELRPVDSFPASGDVDQVSASHDLSIVAILEYRSFCLTDTQRKTQKWHTLEQMSVEVCLSPTGTHLWIGEYQSGIVHMYELSGVDARHVRSANIKDEAKRLIGAPTMGGNNDFRIVATAANGMTTYLYSDDHTALLIYDWAAGRAVGTIPLARLDSHPTFVKSPRGDLLAIIANRLVLVDLKANSVLVDRELGDYSRAGDFNAEGDRFFVAYSAPAMLALPLTHRGGQIEEFDLQGQRLKTWHSKANRIQEFGAHGPFTWMVADDGLLQTLRLP